MPVIAGDQRRFNLYSNHPINRIMLSDFGDLELEDSYRDREGRMRSAFLKSKADYAKEQIFHEPMANIHTFVIRSIH